jgi:hypothetical protein
MPGCSSFSERAINSRETRGGGGGLRRRAKHSNQHKKEVRSVADADGGRRVCGGANCERDAKIKLIYRRIAPPSSPPRSGVEEEIDGNAISSQLMPDYILG